MYNLDCILQFLTAFILLVDTARCIFLPKNYEREKLPNWESAHEPLRVSLCFAIRSFGPVNSVDMTISSEIYMRTLWKDARLEALYENLRRPIRAMDNHSVTYEDHVYLAGDYYNHIWKPDIYFPDAVDLRRPIILEDDSVQLRIDSNMTILYSMRLIVETRCRMEMNLFPLDQQNCPICVSHYKYPREEQYMVWYDHPVEMQKDLSTPHFEVYADITNTTELYESMGRKYTNLCAHIKFRRKLTQYIFVMYFPSFTLTGLSFLNFWIDKKAVPARASLSITSILAQITLMTGVTVSFPSGSDWKIIDIYLLVNFMFTVGTIVEFTIVSYTGSDIAVEKRKRRNTIEMINSEQHRRMPKQRDLDQISRKLVLTLFLVWNASYALLAVYFRIVKNDSTSNQEHSLFP